MTSTRFNGDPESELWVLVLFRNRRQAMRGAGCDGNMHLVPVIIFAWVLHRLCVTLWR